MPSLERALTLALDKRRSQSTLRSLAEPPNRDVVDFSSNDYLSLSTDARLHARYVQAVATAPRVLGSGSSRLLDGNSKMHLALEQRLATFFNAPSALLFNSGFDANVGFFSSVPQRGDVIIYDELIHASVHDGMRSSRARDRLHAFPHNSVEGLRTLLCSLFKEQPGFLSGKSSVFVAVESLYSMDGDFCPLLAIAQALQELLPCKNGYLIVDEAHSTGICGPQGKGLVSLLGLDNLVFARLCTFGKALASSGAVLLTSSLIRHYLINYSRPLIYSTALSYFNIISINCSLDMLEDGTSEKLAARLSHLGMFCRSMLQIYLPSWPSRLLSSSTLVSSDNLNSPIIPLLTPYPRSLASFVQSHGFMARPITYPTVPRGRERIRICLHAANTEVQVKEMLASVSTWVSLQQETNGPYSGDSTLMQLRSAKL